METWEKWALGIMIAFFSIVLIGQCSEIRNGQLCVEKGGVYLRPSPASSYECYEAKRIRS